MSQSPMSQSPMSQSPRGESIAKQSIANESIANESMSQSPMSQSPMSQINESIAKSITNESNESLINQIVHHQSGGSKLYFIVIFCPTYSFQTLWTSKFMQKMSEKSNDVQSREKLRVVNLQPKNWTCTYAYHISSPPRPVCPHYGHQTHNPSNK